MKKVIFTEQHIFGLLMVKRNFYYKREVQQKNLIRIVGIFLVQDILEQEKVQLKERLEN